MIELHATLKMNECMHELIVAYVCSKTKQLTYIPFICTLHRLVSVNV